MTWKNLINCLFAMLCAVSAPLWSQTLTPPNDIQGFDRFMTFYYQNPRPDFILETIKCLNANKWPDKQEQFAPVIGFYAAVFAQNPLMVQRWTDEIQVCEGNTKEVLELGLNASMKLEKLTKGDLSNTDPSSNDFYWGAFFGSGDTIFLSPIVENLSYLTEKSTLNQFLTAASAQWSLSSNAVQHPIVKQFLQCKAIASEPAIATAIKDALELEPGQFRSRAIEIVKKQHEKGIW